MALILEIRADSDKAVREIRNTARKAGAEVKKLESTSKKSSGVMTTSFAGVGKTLGALGIAFGATQAIRGITNFVTQGIKLAGSLEESFNAVEVVFKDAADTIFEFGETSSQSVLLTQLSFNRLATVTGALLKQSGRPLNEVADLTVMLTRRAADMASVFETDVEEALFAVNAALRGETEPIRRFAVDVTDATLKAFALAEGIEKSVTEMSQQEKVLLRLRSIMAQTNDVQGDLERTSGSFSNTLKRVNVQWEEFQTRISREFLPVAQDLLKFFDEFFTEERIDSIVEFTRAFISFLERTVETAQDIPTLLKPFTGIVILFNETKRAVLGVEPSLDDLRITTDDIARSAKGAADDIDTMSSAMLDSQEPTEEMIKQQERLKRALEDARRLAAGSITVEAEQLLRSREAETLKSAQARALVEDKILQSKIEQKLQTVSVPDLQSIRAELEAQAEAESRAAQMARIRKILAEELGIELEGISDSSFDIENSIAGITADLIRAASAGENLAKSMARIALTLGFEAFGRSLGIPGFGQIGSAIGGLFQHGGTVRVPGPDTGRDDRLLVAGVRGGETVNFIPPGQTVNNNSNLNLSFTINGFSGDIFDVKTKLIPLIRRAMIEEGLTGIRG